MEISLNLLPPRLLTERTGRRRKRQRVIAIAAAVLPLLLIYILLAVRIEALRARSASLDRQLAPLRPVAARVLKLDGELAVLRQREEALARVAGGAPHWSLILVQLSGLVPADVWFTGLSVSGNQLSLSGQSLSEPAVTTLAARLSNAQFLTGASLKYIREDRSGARRIFTFAIAGTLRPGAPTP